MLIREARQDDGLIAVNKMSRKGYDLVLMDIMMPNLDGCSASALIRQFNSDTPIIAMTSNIRRDDINSYFGSGRIPVWAPRLRRRCADLIR